MESELEGQELPINFVVSPDARAEFANHFVVQSSDTEFLLSMFQLFPPILLGTPEDKREYLRLHPTVDAKCVCQVVIPQDKMKDLIRILLERYQKHGSRGAKIQDSNGANGNDSL